jgi:hypothetical protein
MTGIRASGEHPTTDAVFGTAARAERAILAW